jgi:tetratricopeptide (TPR) repeat protein
MTFPFNLPEPIPTIARIILCFLVAPAIASAQSGDALSAYQHGREAIARGDADKAVEFFEKAVELKPREAEYHYRLAGAYGMSAMSGSMFGALPKAKKARTSLERAVALNPDFLLARFALLEFHVSAPGIFGGSEAAALEQAAEIRKRDAIEGARAFAQIHIKSDRMQLARKEYVEMVKAHPASARAHYLFGLYLLLNEKNYKSATDELESAIRLDPAYMPSYFRIGHTAALAQSNFARGEETLKKYLAYRPKDDEPSAARAHYWLGAIYEKQGKAAEAKASYTASLRINPNQKDAVEAMKRIS